METCSVCGAVAEAPPGGLPAGWSLVTVSRRGRGVRRLCLDCTRRNIRAIEGKLPEEWWE